MVKKLALLAIRLLVSVNLLYAAIFLKFAGVGLAPLGEDASTHRRAHRSRGLAQGD